MARLIELDAEDFCLFPRLHVKLSDQGLVFIGGEDHDTDAAVSNGSGKSTIFKALSWGLFGRAIDGVEGDKVIRDGQKCARVTILMEDDDDTYRIVRERRKQSPKLKVFKNDNDKPEDQSKADLQLLINRLVGVDWDGFRNTVLYGQNDHERFVYPTTKDSDRKDILHRILRTGIFAFCHEEAKSRNRDLKKKESDLEKEIENAGERIDDFDLDELKSRVEAFADEVKEQVRELAEEGKALAAQSKATKQGKTPEQIQALIDTTNTELQELARQIRETKKARDMAEDRRADWSDKVAGLEAKRAADVASLKLLKGEKCPTCTGPLTKGHGFAHRQSLKARRDSLDADIIDAKESRQKALQTRQSHRTALASHEAERDRLTDVNGDRLTVLAEAKAAVARAADLARQAREKAEEARAAKDQDNPHQIALAEAKQKVGKLKHRRKEARAELEDASGKRAYVEFWTRGYGPSGLPSFVLDATMPYLTERANHYLETLSDGDITIHFSTQRELKSASGEFRDEIAITWMVEGVADYPPSGGQFKKMEIATDLAMMDLVATRESSHVSVLCLDECLDGLDAQGRIRIMKLLHDLRSTRETIFVISHDADLGEIFEKSLLVVKEDGVSHLEEAA